MAVLRACSTSKRSCRLRIPWRKKGPWTFLHLYESTIVCLDVLPMCEGAERENDCAARHVHRQESINSFGGLRCELKIDYQQHPSLNVRAVQQYRCHCRYQPHTLFVLHGESLWWRSAAAEPSLLTMSRHERPEASIFDKMHHHALRTPTLSGRNHSYQFTLYRFF